MPRIARSITPVALDITDEVLTTKVSFPGTRVGEQMSRNLIYLLASSVLIAVAVIYWPVTHANFVWDDWQSFHDKPWLTQGDQWKHYIFNDFNDWTYYFRPLVVAFFTLQVRLFDSAPGPMHAVSLTIHLINTALVGVLSWQCAELAKRSGEQRTWFATLCMALYGLHPALIEPVAWIGCQFDLIMTTLTLLGLIANMRLRQSVPRTTALTALFFLAACSKEAAIAFPLLIVVFDWMLVSSEKESTAAPMLPALIRRNWPAYVGILLAGSAYLIFRRLALGSIADKLQTDSISLLAHLQVISFLYLHYWKIILWPIAGMSPIHPFDIQAFAAVSPSLLAKIVLAFGIFGAGLYASIRRASPFGHMILAVTAALFPVLQIIPGHFEQSLYHERYATLAVAVLCAMLPLARWPGLSLSKNGGRTPLLISLSAIFLWLAFSIVDIRVILPKWSSDVSLWEWALAINPHASQAKSNLLQAYMRDKDYAAATNFANELLADPDPCFMCMIGITEIALSNHDLLRAAQALEKAGRSSLLKTDPGMLQHYYQLNARLLIQENKLDSAEKIMQTAIAVDPKNRHSQSLLAEILVLEKQSTPSH